MIAGCYCRLGFGRLLQAELSSLKGGAGRPFPEGESVVPSPVRGNAMRKPWRVEGSEKRQRIKLAAKRIIAAYGGSGAERLNEGNAFLGDGLRSRCPGLQPNLLAKGDGFRPSLAFSSDFRCR